MLKKGRVFETVSLGEDTDEIYLLEALVEKANIMSPPFVDSTFRDIKEVIKIIKENKDA